MKAFLSLIIIFALACTSKTSQTQKTDTGDLGLVFPHDSGFIFKKTGLKFLLSISDNDSAFSAWHDIADNDTVAKYYKNNTTGNYIICARNLTDPNDQYGTNILLEISKDGRILTKQTYSHSLHPCCLKNKFAGFNKIGNYCTWTVCGTGTGTCSSSIYFFTTVLAQNSQTGILSDFYSYGPNGRLENLSSKFEVLNNQINVKYQYTLENETSDTNKMVSSKEFTIKYLLDRGHWQASDRSELKSIGY